MVMAMSRAIALISASSQASLRALVVGTCALALALAGTSPL